MDDIEAMDDPTFLAERRRVRSELELETRPSEELIRRSAELDDEFIKRASAAWTEPSR